MLRQKVIIPGSRKINFYERLRYCLLFSGGKKIHCWWWQWELKVSGASVADLLLPWERAVQGAELRVSVPPSVHLHLSLTDQHHTVGASEIKNTPLGPSN